MAVQGHSSKARISVEPIQNCRQREFLLFMKDLFKLAFPGQAKIPDSVADVVKQLTLASTHPSLEEHKVEMVRCKPPHVNSGNRYNIFIIEVAFKHGKRPSGAPLSGTYQGSAAHFMQTLF